MSLESFNGRYANQVKLYTIFLTCDQAVLVDQPFHLINGFFRTLVEIFGTPSQILIWSEPVILVWSDPGLNVLEVANARNLEIRNGALGVQICNA